MGSGALALSDTATRPVTPSPFNCPETGRAGEGVVSQQEKERSRQL